MRYIIYAGVKGKSDRCGIHSFSYDSGTHMFVWLRREDKLRGFTHLALSEKGLVLEATGKDDQHEDIMVGYTIDPRNGALTRSGAVRLDTSNDVCHLDISNDGTTAVVTDFINKGIHVWSLDSKGAPVAFLGRVPFSGSSTSYRQGSTHLHSAFFSNDDNYILVSDLGANRVWSVCWKRPSNEFVTVSEWKGRDGVGQRHVAMHPNGKYVYALCEITAEIGVLELQADGELREICMRSAMDQPLPDYNDQDINDIGLPDNYIAAGDIVVSPDGEYLFVSIRMIKELSVFKIMPNGDIFPVCFIHTEGTTRCMRVGVDAKTVFAFGEESSFTGGTGIIEVFEFDDVHGVMRRVAKEYVPGTFIGAILPDMCEV